MHGMIDLETLGVKPNSAILTVGAIKFNPFTDDEPHDGLYLRINVDDQTELGRTIDQDTLNWWAKQKASIREKTHSICPVAKISKFFLIKSIVSL